MKERKKTILWILLVALYVAVVIVLALVIPIVFGRDNDVIRKVRGMVAVVLIVPVVILIGALLDLLDKENRKEWKQSIRDDRVMREEFRVPDDVETVWTFLPGKTRLAVSIVLIFLGLIVSLGACAVFSFVSFHAFSLSNTAVRVYLPTGRF